MPKATRVGVASAKDASGMRTYWAMEIAGGCEPKGGKGRVTAAGAKQGRW